MRYNEEKEHYKSLISLLKYGISFSIGIVSVLGALIGYITYNNGKDLKAAMEAEKQEYKTAIVEMKSDLKEQQEYLNKREKLIEENLITDIDYTKEQALKQIGNIQVEATTAARSKIEEVFKTKNLDSYIADVAKEKLEPKIQVIVDENQSKRINTAIQNLKSKDINAFESAINFLAQNKDLKFSDSQISEIINIVKNSNFSERVLADIELILLYRRSNITTKYFKELLANTKDMTSNTVLQYLMQPELEQDINIYSDYYIKHCEGWEDIQFEKLITIAAIENIKLTIKLLNCKDIVNRVYARGDLGDIGRFKLRIKEHLKQTINEQDFVNTYFFAKPDSEFKH